MKFINFFLFLRVIFAVLDPDPGTLLNPDPIHIHNIGWRYMRMCTTEIAYLPPPHDPSPSRPSLTDDGNDKDILWSVNTVIDIIISDI